MHKSLEIPAVLADVMRAGLKGELNFGVETRPSPEVAPLVREIAPACGGYLSPHHKELYDTFADSVVLQETKLKISVPSAGLFPAGQQL